MNRREEDRIVERVKATLNQKFSDEKAHYLSLIALFTTAMVILGAVAGGVIWMTYSDRKAMTDEMKETTKEIKNSLNSISEKSIAEFSQIKVDAENTAITSANLAIEEIFKRNNIDSFIINVAKNHLSPEVKKQIIADKERIIDNAIEQISSTDNSDMSAAFLTLHINNSSRLSDKQINRLISIYRKDVNDMRRQWIVAILLMEKTDVVSEFFEEIYKTEVAGSNLQNAVVKYLITVCGKNDFNYYIPVLEKHPNKIDFLKYFIDFPRKDSKLVINFLNNKKLAEIMLKSYEQNQYAYLVGQIQMLAKLSEDELNGTLLIKKLQNEK